MSDTPASARNVLVVRKIGNSLGVILPREIVARMRVEAGDNLQVVEQPERGIQLTPYDEKHQKAMEIARKAFREYANTFKALAK